MFPISGSFEHFLWKHSDKKNLTEGNTVGLLFVDPRQTQIRDFVTNYMDVFNQESDKYIDFYLPGFRKVNDESHYDMTISNTFWKFEPDVYNSFVGELRDRKIINFTTSAFLLLMEIGHHKTSFKKYMKIGIDSPAMNPQEAGPFFKKLFEYSKSEIEFQKIEKWVNTQSSHMPKQLDPGMFSAFQAVA